MWTCNEIWSRERKYFLPSFTITRIATNFLHTDIAPPLILDSVHFNLHSSWQLSQTKNILIFLRHFAASNLNKISQRNCHSISISLSYESVSSFDWKWPELQNSNCSALSFMFVFIPMQSRRLSSLKMKVLNLQGSKIGTGGLLFMLLSLYIQLCVNLLEN